MLKKILLLVIASMLISLLSAQVVYIGNPGSEQSTMENPFNFFYRAGLSQTIYLSENITASGMITHLEYYFVNLEIAETKPVKIWIANVSSDLTEFANNNSWVAFENFTEVYNGYFNPGPMWLVNNVMIELDVPFLYQEGNIVIMTERLYDPNDTSYIMSSFLQTPSPENRALNWGSNSNGVIDPTNPNGNGNLSENIPNISITFTAATLGSLEGMVTTGTPPTPLEEVSISIDGTILETTTNELGEYSITNLNPGLINITASKTGYITEYISNIEIQANQPTLQNITLNPITTVSVFGFVRASDTEEPLSGASVILSGYATLPEVFTDENGWFVIEDVFVYNSYILTITSPRYYTYIDDSIEVNIVDFDTGTIILTEAAFPPTQVVATNHQSFATITWLPPDIPTANLRALESYNIYRVLEIEMADEDLWTTLDIGLTTLEYTDDTWEFVAEGVYRYIVKAVYTNNNLSPAAVSNFLMPLPTNVSYIGDPLSPSFGVLPFAYQFQTSIAQFIYYESEINNSGFLSSIEYTLTGNNNLPDNINHRIWLATTDEIDFPNDMSWIPYNQFTLVFEGHLPVTVNGTHNITINLDTPFLYPEGSGNLAIMTERQTVGSFQNGNLWQRTETGTIRSIHQNRNGEDYHLEDLPFGFLSTTLPNIKLTFTDIILVSVSGNILGSDTNEPIENAEITLHNASFTYNGINSNAQGEFSIDNVYGNYMYALTITKEGFITYTDTNITVADIPLIIPTITLQIIVNDTDTPIISTPTTLKGNYPNPFNPSTTIEFSLTIESNIKIDIYNIKGQKIKTLLDTTLKAGEHNITWNGKDDYDRDVTSGVFFYQMKTDNYSATKKMMILK